MNQVWHTTCQLVTCHAISFPVAIRMISWQVIWHTKNSSVYVVILKPKRIPFAPRRGLQVVVQLNHKEQAREWFSNLHASLMKFTLKQSSTIQHGNRPPMKKQNCDTYLVCLDLYRVKFVYIEGVLKGCILFPQPLFKWEFMWNWFWAHLNTLRHNSSL